MELIIKSRKETKFICHNYLKMMGVKMAYSIKIMGVILQWTSNLTQQLLRMDSSCNSIRDTTTTTTIIIMIEAATNFEELYLIREQGMNRVVNIKGKSHKHNYTKSIMDIKMTIGMMINKNIIKIRI